ncbi:MAG: response regulator [Pseudomonadota bacterium]|nr:response regulator [Pseudomonadota bacterium]
MNRPGLILLAEDDPDDRILLEHAFRTVGVVSELVFVEDGEELMDYLRGRGRHTGGPGMRPDLILLDLNMPRKDGREALAEIKQDPRLRQIPVVVLTTSNAAQDIRNAYDLGANSFITKPVSFDELARMLATVDAYWFGTVSLPTDR